MLGYTNRRFCASPTWTILFHPLVYHELDLKRSWKFEHLNIHLTNLSIETWHRVSLWSAIQYNCLRLPQLNLRIDRILCSRRRARSSRSLRLEWYGFAATLQLPSCYELHFRSASYKDDDPACTVKCPHKQLDLHQRPPNAIRLDISSSAMISIPSSNHHRLVLTNSTPSSAGHYQSFHDPRLCSPIHLRMKVPDAIFIWMSWHVSKS